MLISSLIFTSLTNPQTIVSTMMTSAKMGVTMAIEFIGIYAVWLGFMQVLDDCKLSHKLSNILSRPVRKIFGPTDKETEKIYWQQLSKKLPQSVQRIALRKLIMIDNAETLEDLRVPPGNHLEMLKGERQGQYSIRINDQYRICFTITDRGFENVGITDYHR